MNLRERIQYYLEIIRYYIKNNIICRWMFWFGGNFLILYLSYRASRASMKYITVDSIRYHKKYLAHKSY